VMRYCSKNYMGKECAVPDGWENVGRFWGIVGRKNLPRSKVMEVQISRDAFHKVRRTARRWFAAKGDDPARKRGADALHVGAPSMGPSHRLGGDGPLPVDRFCCAADMSAVLIGIAPRRRLPPSGARSGSKERSPCSPQRRGLRGTVVPLS